MRDVMLAALHIIGRNSVKNNLGVAAVIVAGAVFMWVVKL